MVSAMIVITVALSRMTMIRIMVSGLMMTITKVTTSVAMTITVTITKAIKTMYHNDSASNTSNINME